MDVACPKCHSSFSFTCNLSRHLKEKHGDRKKSAKDRRVLCDLCGKEFKRKDHLQYHMDAVHFTGETKHCSLCEYSTVNKYSLNRHVRQCHKDNIVSQTHSTLQESEELHPSTTKPLLKGFVCSICGLQFKSMKTLNVHLRKIHSYVDVEPKASVSLPYKKCPICFFTVASKSIKHLNNEIHKHFKDVHHTPIEMEELEFTSISEFNAWKTNIEAETTSRFIRRNRHEQKTSAFVCHRSGHFVSRSLGKRSLKMVGSSKINGFCPASIISKTKDSGKVFVKFSKTHIGHKTDLKHIFLSAEEREIIANKLAENVPDDEILREIWSSDTSPQLERLHLTTKKDLLNIKRSLNLSDEAVKHPYDLVSVEISRPNENSVGSEVNLLETKEVFIAEHVNTNNMDQLCAVPYDLVNVDNSRPTENFVGSEVNLLDAKEAFIAEHVNTLRSGINNMDQLCAVKNGLKSVDISRPTENFVGSEVNLLEAKEAFIAEHVTTLRSGINNMNQLCAVKDHCKVIKPMLQSIHKTAQRSTKLRMNIKKTTTKANITKQRKFISIKRTKTKMKTYPNSSQTENNELATQLISQNRTALKNQPWMNCPVGHEEIVES